MRSTGLAASAAGRHRAITVPPPTPTGVRAFPTAEGFGAEALGGRGSGANDANRMTVYKVTNLTDPATRAGTFDGSFRWACEATGPRVVVFDVAGYIVLNKPLAISNPFCTIAGQTAPGDGICLRSAQKSGMAVPFRINSSHTIVRHLRSRMYIDPALGTPGASHSAICICQGIPGQQRSDIIIDHCSGTWAYDVCIQIMDADYDRITVQWCLAGEGYQNAHQRAMSTYGGAAEDQDTMGNITFHHNLMVRGDYRHPHIATKWGKAEIYNNISYYFTSFGANINTNAHGIPGTPGKVRYVGNYLKRVTSTNQTDGVTGQSGPTNCISGFIDATHDERYLVYTYGNIGPGRLLDTDPQVNALATSQRQHYASDPECTGPPNLIDMGNAQAGSANTLVSGFPDGKFHLPNIPVTDTTAAQAYRDVLQDTTNKTVPAGAVTPGSIGAGACRPTRDACDQRIFTYTIDDTAGAPLVNALPPEGFPTLATTPANAADTGVQAWAPAGDGIPAAWVAANIPAGKFPYSLDVNGYAYAENYLNELAGDTIP